MKVPSRAVRAAMDRHSSIPRAGDQGSGSAIGTATAVVDGRGSVLALGGGARADGLIESREHDIDLGLERLRLALTHPPPSLDTVCDNVIKAALSGRPGDDVALLVARTHALAGDQVATWDLPADPAVVAATRRQVAAQLEGWGLGSSSANSSRTRSGTPGARSSSGSSGTGRSSARSPTAAAAHRTAPSPGPRLRRARAFDDDGRGLLLVSQLS